MHNIASWLQDAGCAGNDPADSTNVATGPTVLTSICGLCQHLAGLGRAAHITRVINGQTGRAAHATNVCSVPGLRFPFPVMILQNHLQRLKKNGSCVLKSAFGIGRNKTPYDEVRSP